MSGEKSDRIVAIERVLKALANRRRLAIIQFLRTKGHVSVGDIAEHIRLSFAATSRHHKTLDAADLVEYTQVNTTVNYSLPKNKHPALDAVLKLI